RNPRCRVSATSMNRGLFSRRCLKAVYRHTVTLRLTKVQCLSSDPTGQLPAVKSRTHDETPVRIDSPNEIRWLRRSRRSRGMSGLLLRVLVEDLEHLAL